MGCCNSKSTADEPKENEQVEKVRKTEKKNNNKTFDSNERQQSDCSECKAKENETNRSEKKSPANGKKKQHKSAPLGESGDKSGKKIQQRKVTSGPITQGRVSPPFSVRLVPLKFPKSARNDRDYPINPTKY